ncbi:B-cell receptor CD22 [Polypterus senegalus]|uniref:B-cell receptor CD22 n=1 Tax=Polypterus senegalus TaxID=55291 RepID=UPI0019665501|nr:B-cell receptor CD22 [Polypterus senegalus]
MADTKEMPGTLVLNNISYKDSGIYTCAAVGNGQRLSVGIVLNVQYAPKNTSASISPMGEIQEGSFVLLTCNSSANPQNFNYEWYKWSGTSDTLIGSGQYFIFNKTYDINNGLYFCVAMNEIGSQKSTYIHLYVAAKLNADMYIIIASGCFLAACFGFMTLLIYCKRESINKKVCCVWKPKEVKQEAVNTVYENVTASYPEDRNVIYLKTEEDNGLHYSSFNFRDISHKNPEPCKNNPENKKEDSNFVIYSATK